MRIAGGFDSFSQRDAECGADPDPTEGSSEEQPVIYPQSYDYVRVWHETSGSLPYYVEGQLRRARQTNAPLDAIYEQSDWNGRTGKWKRIGDVKDETFRHNLHEAVRRLRTKRELRNR